MELPAEIVPHELRVRIDQASGIFDARDRINAIYQLILERDRAATERAAKIAQAEKANAIAIYPVGEQRGIAVAVADFRGR